MNNQAAANIISDTFTRPFDEGRFALFIRNLLNDKIDESKSFDYYGNYIPDAFKKHVRRYKRLGTYTDPGGYKIDILTVQLVRSHSLLRARTAQRNFIAWYLKRRDEKDAALVAYYSDELEDWRFSFVRMEYSQELDGSGRVKVREQLTPARRYSFLVGKNEPSHTAQAQLLPLVSDTVNNPTLDEIEKAFSVETVTERFYKEYRGLFERLVRELDAIQERDERVHKEFEIRMVDTANFAKKLLGQIVFLYFLQKKGWLGVGRDENGRFRSWGHGPRNFLRRLFEGGYIEYDNFFNDILEPLFYTALAVERENDYYDRLDVRIPFLNGGLFDPINGYNWQETDILIGNGFFRDLFQVFDTYNFTVCEDEPLEKEVAVDPEMLGKVFENLLPTNLRKGQGAYYTPRTIVHFMCQESLISYLDNEINRAQTPILTKEPFQRAMFKMPGPKQAVFKVPGKKTVIKRKDIEEFIKKGEFAIENDMAKLGGTKSYSFKLPDSIIKNAALLDEMLSSIKVCDPAIGSGAFAVGMMHEIVKARRVLSTYITPDDAARTQYDLKRTCIQESIYGVDIDPGAIDIAQLRLWLSLVVDEDDYHSIRPLPNLDYKIMQGDSLIEDFHGISLELASKKKARIKSLWSSEDTLEGLIHELHQKQCAFFNAVHINEKRQAKKEVEETIIKIFRYELERQKEEYFRERRRIEEKVANITPNSPARKKYLETELSRLNKKYGIDIQELEMELREMTHGNVPRTFFPWRLYFGDVFQEKGGFDIVIGNPPYVRQEIIRQIKPRLKEHFKAFYCGTADLYTYFYKRGSDILREGGHLCFIAPNKFMRARYGKNTRRLLSQEVTPRLVIDFGDLPIFDATTYPAIILVKKRKPAGNEIFKAATFTEKDQINDIDTTLSKIGFEMRVSDLKEEGWNLERPEVLALMEKLRRKGMALKEYVNGRFYRGILTGLNKAFVIDQKTRDRLIEEDPKSEELIKPWLRGKDIKRWKAQWAGLYVIFTRRGVDIDKYPAIKSYLGQFRKELTPKPKGAPRNMPGRKPGPYKWYEIQDNIAYYKEFEGPKIVYQVFQITPCFLFDNECMFTNNASYIIPEGDKYLLAYLNSSLGWFMIKQFCSNIQNGYQLMADYFGRSLIFPAIPSQKSSIISLVEKILADPDGPEVPYLEKKIDALIYDLYGLTEEEIAIVEQNTSS